VSGEHRKPSRTRRGQAAEDLAVAYLTELGYQLVARNHRCREGEVDIIARDGDVLCFVEVRSLGDPSQGDPLETISPQKIRRVVKAAWNYVEEVIAPSGAAWPVMRFDAVGITMADPPTIRLVREAFEA